MKKMAFILLVALSGCVKDEINVTYKVLTPIWADKATVLADISSGPARSIENAGKLFIKGNYIYINEIDKGVHIIDNSDPSSPKPVAFVSIPGNIDLAVKANYLYADMYADMLTIDITDPLQAKLIDTSSLVFPERFYGNNFSANAEQVIVGWEEKTETMQAEDDSFGCANCIALPDANFSQSNDGNKAAYVPGIAGSMSRFVTVDDYLYTVNSSSLIAFDVTDPSSPQRKNENQVGWLIETVYPFKDKLFIGSAAGMFIFDISNPLAPQRQGVFTHARTCDPVVSDGNYAYVTLRSGDQCAGNIDQLDIVDVENVMRPSLVKTYPMTNPFGLAKDGNILFICDGKDGIKIYDATEVNDLRLIHRIADVEAFDVIPWAGRLMASTKQGLKQYDYSNIGNIRLLSTIQFSASK